MKPQSETKPIQAGETLAEFAAAKLGDASAFRDILEANPELDPEETLFDVETLVETVGSEFGLRVPGLNDLLPAVTPILSRVQSVASTATGFLNKVEGFLPPELDGYTSEALKALGDVNGALSGVSTTDLPSLVNGLLRGDNGAVSDENGLTHNPVEWLLGETPRSGGDEDTAISKANR